MKSRSKQLIGRHVIFGHAPRGDDPHEKYMTRYWFWRFRLHLMHRGDMDLDCHDHPWRFWTFPLKSYVEEVFDPSTGERRLNLVKRFRLHYRGRGYAHRILGPSLGSMAKNESIYKVGTNEHLEHFHRLGLSAAERTIPTLVYRGRKRGNWGFYVPAPAGEYQMPWSTDWKWVWSEEYLAPGEEDGRASHKRGPWG